MLKQGQWSWQGMHHARSNTPYKGLSFSWQAVSVKSSSEAAKRNSATAEALVKPFTTSKLFLSTSQPAPAWDSWTIERNNALKSKNCEPHNMFWTPHNFCEKSVHKNLTPDPIIGIEQSNGSRPRSKPPNKMDSAVWSQSVTTGRPSSGLSNLFWVKHINGFYQVLAKSIVFVFLGVGKLKQKPDNKKSGRKHVIGSLVVSLSIDGSISLTYHCKCSHVLLFQQKQSETNFNKINEKTSTVSDLYFEKRQCFLLFWKDRASRGEWHILDTMTPTVHNVDAHHSHSRVLRPRMLDGTLPHPGFPLQTQ